MRVNCLPGAGHCRVTGRKMYGKSKFQCIVALFCLYVWRAGAVPPGMPTSDLHGLQNKRLERRHQKDTHHNISIIGNDFMLDGKPLYIRSGSIHYFRVPAAYWRDRLRKLKQAGFNAVSTYVEWSFHESEERQYSFEGDRDVSKFIRTAAEEGLHVLLRPGPYICAERDLGGFPYWLLGKYPNIKLRSTDADFMQESRIWLTKLFEHMTPLLYGNGGPVILVQVENEYGSYGSDMQYKTQMRDIYKQLVGDNAILYTTDGANWGYFSKGYIPDTLTTIDFGAGANVTELFNELRRFMPQGPLMNSEYYPGWLTHWGEEFQTVDTSSVVATMRDMLDKKIHFNVYVFFGGTNFEFTSGANLEYLPDITSYDYDAPLSEAGDPTPKYYAIRNLMKEYKFVSQNDIEPQPSPKGSYGPVSVTARVSLLSSSGRTALGKKYQDIQGTMLPSFEHLRQRAGLVLYETILKEGEAELRIKSPRDWCYVYIDEKLQGSINRMYKKYSLKLNGKKNIKLSLLVENQGRLNYGPDIQDIKGILSTLTLNNSVFNGKWSVTGYPLQALNDTEPFLGQPDLSTGPVLFEGTFTLTAEQQPLDTFLDTTGWGRGYIWVNGHNLGRYWPGLGPQVTLYVPGVYLNAPPAINKLQILELESAPHKLTMEFINYPILNRTLHSSVSSLS